VPTLRSSLLVLAGSAVGLAASVVVRVLLARVLDPAALGTVLVALAAVTALGGLAGLGAGAAVARRIPELLEAGGVASPAVTARTAMTASLAGGAVGFVLLHGVVRLAPLRQDLAVALTSLSPVVLALPLGLAMLGIARAHGNALSPTLWRDGAGGLWRVAAVAVAAGQGGVGVGSLAVALAAAVAVTEGLFVADGWRRGWLGRRRRVDEPRPVDRRLLAALPRFAALGGLDQVRLWMDLLVVGWLASPAVAGFYAVALGLTRPLYFARRAGAWEVLPAASRAWSRSAGRDELRQRALRLGLGLTWAPVTVLVVAPEVVVELLFGPAYAAAAPILRGLALVTLLEAAVGYPDLLLLAAGREATVVRVRAAASAVAFVGLLLLVPPFGGMGAVAAVALAELLRVAGMAWAARDWGGGAGRLGGGHLLPPVLALAAAWWLAPAGAPPWALLASALAWGSAGALYLLATGRVAVAPEASRSA
jgi:O-antigen/teichoic acid export membrane protein